MSFEFSPEEQFWQRGALGKPATAFESPEDLYASALDAFEWLYTHPKKKALTYHYRGQIIRTYEDVERPFTLEGVCLVMGVTAQTFKRYQEKEDYADVCDWIEEVIRTQMFEGAATNLMNSNIVARKLGLTEKTEVETKQTVVNINGDAADL